MKLRLLFTILSLIVSCISHDIRAAAAGTGKSVGENLIMPKGLSEIFKAEGMQKGKAVGRFTVRDGAKTIGTVRVRLDGASFYNPNVAQDFKVTYWGHNSNGCYFDLPKGLYDWDKAVQVVSFFHTVHPAPNASAALSKVPFDNSIAIGANENEWFAYVKNKHGKGEYKVIWDPSKAKYSHPSKEISDILGK